MSWTAYVTHRWAEGIIDVVVGHSVDEDGDLVCSYPDGSDRMCFAQGTWHLEMAAAIEQAQGDRDRRIESLRARLAETQDEINRLTSLEFYVDRNFERSETPGSRGSRPPAA